MVRAATSIAAFGLLLGGCAVPITTPEAPDMVNTEVHRGAEALDFDPESGTLVSGGFDGKLAVWDLGEGRPIRVWQAHTGPVNRVLFMGPHLVSTGTDAKLTLWNVHGKRLHQRSARSPVVSMALADDRAITGHVDGMVRIWRLPSFQLENEYALHQGWVWAVAIHAETSLLASAGEKGRVFRWTFDSEPRAVDTPPVDARSLTFSPNGDELYGGGWFKLLRWNTVDGRLAVIPTRHWGHISALQFVPGLNMLASISRTNDSSVYFLDPQSGETLRSFARQALCGGAVRLSPNGRYLAATGDDGAIRIWDLEKRQTM